MDKLCRLCLSACGEMAYRLGEKLQILHKLSCLNVQIVQNPFLPSCICSKCFITLEEIHKFRETTTKNELKLLHHLKTGNLDNFYQKLVTINPIDNIQSDENAEYSSGNDDSEAMDDINLSFIKSNTANNGSCTSKMVKTENVHKTDIANTKAKAKVKKPQRKSKFKSEPQTKSKSSKNNTEANDANNFSNLKDNVTKLELEKEFNESNELEISLNTTNNISIEDQKCLTCFKYLISHTELIKHYKNEHSTDSNIENMKSELPKSMTEHHIDDPLNIESKEIVKYENIQKSERPYNCKICGRTFVSVYAIIRHGRAHSSRSMFCSLGCGYSTVYRGALRDHEKRHKKNFKYTCATCGAGFHVRTWHDQHQNLHKKVRPFVCEICGIAFHMDRYLTSHRSAVHPNAAKGISRYSCPHCEISFNNIHSFRVHLELHKGKRSFLCDLCGKVCSSNGQLRRHSDTHSGLKPFSCSICNKKFSRKFNVTVHEKAHAGQKLLCRQCGKYFAQRSTLLRHYRKRHPGFAEDNKIPSTCNDNGKR